MNQMFLYALVIGLMLTLYRAGAKLMSIDPLRGSFLGAIITVLISGTILLAVRPSLDNVLAPNNIYGILLAGSVLVFSGILIIHGLQKGFPVSTYSTLYTICGLIMIALYGILVDGEVVTIKKVIGFILACLSVYFLLVK